MLTLTVSGCVSAGSAKVLCSRTEASISRHADALYIDGGPKSVTTGRVLISQIDAACGF
jgi:hypothetical protein